MKTCGSTDCRIGRNTTHLKDTDLGVRVDLRRRKLLMAACIHCSSRVHKWSGKVERQYTYIALGCTHSYAAKR